MNKEAIVFIVDGNLTMNKTYPPVNERLRSNDDPTRLSQAKDAVLTSIIDLMWRSKTHETGVARTKQQIPHVGYILYTITQNSRRIESAIRASI